MTYETRLNLLVRGEDGFGELHPKKATLLGRNNFTIYVTDDDDNVIFCEYSLHWFPTIIICED